MSRNSKTFLDGYNKLNDAQKSAVDQTDGVVMVIAGPGTGKTQLLAMRVANILHKTDTNADNILCLTFTENAAANMTERLANIIGADAYKVAVHTFHGFGSEIISRHGEHFFAGANFRPADDITTAEIISEILANLPHDNPLAKSMNGQWTYLSDIIKNISDFKKAGLSPNELRKILQQNIKFCSDILLDFRETFEKTISSATIQKAKKLILTAEKLIDSQEKFPFTNEPNLAEIFTKSLIRTIFECEKLDNKTKPLTKWKKEFSTKNDNGEIILKDQKNSEKLLVATEIYEKYIEEMNSRGLFDFDDMIMRVCQAIENSPELKYDLQEQYQYILVDEFQDTNDAQMRLLRNLTNYDNDFQTPNIMIVGDDDQAIYRFQGADISNILNFANNFKNPNNIKTITLTENYRSGKNILSLAQNVAEQISSRLKSNGEKLNENVKWNANISRIVADSSEQENAFIAQEISAKIAAGESPEQIAVIARNHKQLENLLPFLAEQKILVDYERARNVLDSEPVVQLINLATIIVAISRGEVDIINQYLPKILAHPAWQISSRELWQISLEAYQKRIDWLNILSKYSDFTREFSDWLLDLSQRAQNNSLEEILDEMIGQNSQNSTNDFKSPLYDYFFSKSKLYDQPEIYLNFLNDLSTLRNKLRDFQPDRNLKLVDLLEYVERSENLDKPIIANSRQATSDRIKLLTAHKSKGLEFDTVFVINAQSKVWGAESRNRSSMLPLPHNMPFSLSNGGDDERLRLLFVALTRARKNLIVTSHQFKDEKSLPPLEYLLDLNSEKLPSQNIDSTTNQLETSWRTENYLSNSTKDDLRTCLEDTLAKYKLSATHLNNFIDLVNGGPEHFLMQNLLHFPEAKSPQAAFGTAIHGALQRGHTFTTIYKSIKPLKNILEDFVDLLEDAHLSERDRNFYSQKGIDILTNFYDQRSSSFTPTQRVEYGFSNENILINGAKLTGKIDLIDVDKSAKTLVVTDYKTGKPAISWRGRNDNEKVKLHKYRQQLLFYKLLIENSREFSGWTIKQGILEFVEPCEDGKISRLILDYEDLSDEIEDFKKLISVIWRNITTLDFPNVNDFSQDYKGILKFEEFLRESI